MLFRSESGEVGRVCVCVYAHWQTQFGQFMFSPFLGLEIAGTQKDCWSLQTASERSRLHLNVQDCI